MTDPRRLLDGGDAFERELIGSSRVDKGTSSAMHKVLLAVGSGAAMAAGSSAAAASAGKTTLGAASKSSLHVAILKWTALVAVGAIGASAFILTTMESGHAPAAEPYASPSVVLQIASARPVSSDEVTAPRGVEQTSARGATEAPPAVKRAVVRTSEPDAAIESGPDAAASVAAMPAADLAAEVESLQRARVLLESNRPAEALAEVGRYREAFPQGKLHPEAQVIEIEALVRQGNRERALSAARSFAARAPSSPLLSRLRSLLPELERSDMANEKP